MISSALFLFALTSCGGASSSVSSGGSSSASISSSVTAYALTLTGHTELLLERLDPSYPAGVTVEFATSIVYDADLNIYLDGKKIARNVADAPNWHYSFTMPSHDATSDFRIESVEYVPLGKRCGNHPPQNRKRDGLFWGSRDFLFLGPRRYRQCAGYLGNGDGRARAKQDSSRGRLC